MKKRRFHISGEYYDIPDGEVSTFISENPHAEEVRNYKIKGSEYNIPLKEVASFESDMGFDDHTQKENFEKKNQNLQVGAGGQLERSAPVTSQSQENNVEPGYNPFDIAGSLSTNRLDNNPTPKTLDEAHTQDTDKSKAVGKNVWNRFLTGIGEMSSGAADLMFQGIQKIMPDDPYSQGAEADLKKFRAEGLPTIRTATKELAGANVTEQQEKNFNDNFWTSALGGLSQTVPAFLGTKGSSFFLQAYDNGLQVIDNSEAGKNLPESTKSIFGVAVGTSQAVIMKLGLDKIFGKQTTKAATNLAIKTFNNLLSTSKAPITAELFESALSTAAKGLKSKIINAGTKVAKSSATGFLMGSAIEGSNQLSQAILNKSEGRNIFEPETWGQIAGNIIHAGASTAVGAGIMGAATLPFSKTRNYIAEKVAEAKAPEDITNLKNELIFKAKDLSPEEAQHLGQTIDDYVRVNSKVPPDVTNRKEVVDKIIEREDLENTVNQKTQELQTVDDAFKPELQKEVDLFKSKANEINEEITKPKEEAEINIGELIDKPVTYNGKKGYLLQDGQAIVVKIDGQNKEYELGNIDEIKNHPISDYGIEHETSIVNVNNKGNIEVRGNEYQNNYSNPLAAINHDENGNIVSVNLETSDGGKRTFRGNIAEDIAYQINLKEINKNNGTKSDFEQHINEDAAISKEMDNARLSETTPENSTENNEKISREKEKSVINKVEQPPEEKQAAVNEVTERTPEEIKKLTREPIPIEQIGEKVEIQDFETGKPKRVKAFEARTELRNRLKDIDKIIKCL